MSFLRGLLQGAGVGLTDIVDFGGFMVNRFDGVMTGAGSADMRAVPTVSSHVRSKLYDDYTLEHPIRQDLGRFIGWTGGFFGSALAYGTVAAATPLLPLATIGMAAYAGIRTVARYAHDWVVGERTEQGYEKGSFFDGLRYGWHQGSHLGFVNMVHAGEDILTGRGREFSRYETTVAGSAGAARRNLRSLAGTYIGYVGGLFAKAITTIGTFFGGFSLLGGYKSGRDTINHFRGKPVKRHAPTYLIPFGGQAAGGQIVDMPAREAHVAQPAAPAEPRLGYAMNVMPMPNAAHPAPEPAQALPNAA